MNILPWVLTGNEDSSSGSTIQNLVSIDFSSEDSLSALEEVDLLSKVQKLNNDYKSDPELSDGVMDELVSCIKCRTKKIWMV